jgi:hypothetical protein
MQLAPIFEVNEDVEAMLCWRYFRVYRIRRTVHIRIG